LRLSITPCACEYWPERNVARLGAQSALMTKAFSKRMPVAASRSRFGVLSNASFMKENF
jgi:hypothetical protein